MPHLRRISASRPQPAVQDLDLLGELLAQLADLVSRIRFDLENKRFSL